MPSTEKLVCVIRDAYELIQDKERWTKGAFARFADGSEVHPIGQEARYWCAEGALLKACQDDFELYIEARECLERYCGGVILAHYNDSYGHTAILGAFRSALAEVDSFV